MYHHFFIMSNKDVIDLRGVPEQVDTYKVEGEGEGEGGAMKKMLEILVYLAVADLEVDPLGLVLVEEMVGVEEMVEE